MARMATVALAWLLLAQTAGVTSPASQTGARSVLFALQRSERLHAFDAETLQHLGHFVTGPLGDSLGARTDGRMLFLLQPSRDQLNSCCSLRTLDLVTREMCFVSEPSVGEIVVSGGMVAAGGNVFNAQTLAPAPVPRGFYTAFLTAGLIRGNMLTQTR